MCGLDIRADYGMILPKDGGREEGEEDVIWSVHPRRDVGDRL